MVSRWGCRWNERAPSLEGASFIFGAGQKRAPSVVSENTPTDVKEKTREALLAYCEKDTEAMVRVFDVLCSMES